MLNQNPYQIIELPAFQIVGFALRTSNSSAAHDIPQFWDRIYDSGVLNLIPNKISDDVYGLYTDYEGGDHTAYYTLIAGCRVSSIQNLTEEMIAKVVPEASYALFTAKGEFPKSVYETWQKIWHTELPRTYTGDFEVYGDKFHNDSEVDIYIAISR
jgi:predicted transcriptional regulator YdeE